MSLRGGSATTRRTEQGGRPHGYRLIFYQLLLQLPTMSSQQLTHKLIDSDGYFKEVSEQWPGQAFALKVKKVLHVEQSKFQVRLSCRSYGRFQFLTW